MSYCTEALAIGADLSRSNIVTKPYFEWLWCLIIPSSGGGGSSEPPWIAFIRAVRSSPVERTLLCPGLVLVSFELYCKILLLQPRERKPQRWRRYYNPCWIPVQSYCKSPTERSGPSLAPSPILWIPLVVQAPARAALPTVFVPCTHVYKSEQVSLSAWSVLPCSEFLFLWGLGCNPTGR